MAVRIVYVLNNKNPDVVQDGKSWFFHEGTLKILNGKRGAAKTELLVEIRADFVLSVEHVNFPEEPEKAPEEAPTPRKRAKKAS
jgi:hypothetical protein